MMRLLLTIVALFLAAPAWAQINLKLDFNRDRFLLYESMVATVEVSSYAAGEVKLEDEESTPWLRFDIARPNGEHIGMVGPGYLAGAVTLTRGQGIRKSVDVVQYYQVREPGKYRIRALVKVAGYNGTFASAEKVIDVASGRQLLTRTAGVKDDTGKESIRVYSVMELLLPPHSWLYARVEDQSSGVIYGVIPLGEWVTFSAPLGETDKDGNLHVLHQSQPRQYHYSVITPKASVLKREMYSNYNSVPGFKRAEDGQIKVVGGEAMGRPAPPPPPKSP